MFQNPFILKSLEIASPHTLSQKNLRDKYRVWYSIISKENTAWKVSVFGVILVRIFPHFPAFGLNTERYVRISSYSVRMRKNVGKMWTRITPNTVSFYAVLVTRLFLNSQKWREKLGRIFMTFSRNVIWNIIFTVLIFPVKVGLSSYKKIWFTCFNKSHLKV